MAHRWRVRLELAPHHDAQLRALLGALEHLEPEHREGPPAAVEVQVSAWSSDRAIAYVGQILDRHGYWVPQVRNVIDLTTADHRTDSQR